MRRVIFWLFAVLLFLVPLILWPFTSEVFEFNKMVLVYLLTTLITASWIVQMVFEKKFIFRRTILDIPLLVFIGSQLISTILSIDPLTSWLGYYSRFNGGFLSTLSYSLLYWAFVSNIDCAQTKKLIKFSILPSAALVAFYGVLEHFGIDKNLWVQDVQSRVFSTLGQPNWLAAWLVALMPVTWALTMESGRTKQESGSAIKSLILNSKFLIPLLLSILFFWAFIFTKSRSGLLGFIIAFLIFWGFYFWCERNGWKKHLIPFALITASIILVCLISGTEFTPSLKTLITKSTNLQMTNNQTGTTSLETGGTESGKIRAIVWKGALQVWLHYPIFGTGVETFAYSYYLYRPAEHNLTSEWDFVYNKAHNEYLNFMANSGTVGILSYLALIFFSILAITNYQLPIFKKLKNDQLINSMKIENCELKIALFAGFSSLLVTNFFGFSVVPTQLEFFLFPAMAIALSEVGIRNQELGNKKITSPQKISIALTIILSSFLLFQIGKYWYADTRYNYGKSYNSVGQPDIATKYLTAAIAMEPNQPLYESELASSYASLAVAFNKQKDSQNTAVYANLAVSASDKATNLSPSNLILKMSRFGIFIMLATTNPNYLINARDTLLDAIKYAPTYAKLYYNLGLTYARMGQLSLATETLKKAIDLKANYKEARLAYAILLIDQKQVIPARDQLNYILTNIDPNDSLTKQTLAGIK